MERGEARAEFQYLASLETDDCVLWPGGLDGKGYGRIKIKGHPRYVHDLALERRIGPRPKGMETAHDPIRCGNTACMNYRHLRWATRQENINDMVLAGTRPRGEMHGGARLTQESVKAIRDSPLTGRTLANLFGVSEATISRVRNHRLWSET